MKLMSINLYNCDSLKVNNYSLLLFTVTLLLSTFLTTYNNGVIINSNK